MSRRIDIELTSTREDGSWTWRAAGAREPKGTLDGSILPDGAKVGDVLKAETEDYLDGFEVVAIIPPRAPRREPQRLELLSPRRDDTPLITTDVRRRSDRRRSDRRRGRDEGRDGERRGRDRQARHDRGRSERAGRGGERQGRAAAGRAPAEAKPKPKRLRPGRTHRTALLESLPVEQRPIAEQLLQGGIPAVRQAIDKQNQALKAEGKPEVNRDALLKVAEDIRPKAMAALWRDRAEAAAAAVDEIDLRDLRSVVNAAGDAGRDEESRALAARLREALADRVEKEHAAWLAELAEAVREGRVVRALRLSSRPPKAGAPIPADLTNELAEAASQALTSETGQDRWATVLDALAYSPVRRRVIPQSLPPKLSPQLRETIARLGTRLPEIAHIFDIEPDESAGRAAAPGRAGRRGRGRGDAGGSGSGGSGSGGGGPRSSGRRRSGRGQSESGSAEATSESAADGSAESGGSSTSEPGSSERASEATAESASAESGSAEATPEASEAAAEPEPPAASEAAGGSAPEAAASGESANGDATSGEPASENGTSGEAGAAGDQPAAEHAEAEPGGETVVVGAPAEAASAEASGEATAETGGSAEPADSGDAGPSGADDGDRQPAGPVIEAGTMPDDPTAN
ncbi:MAG TPA: hypothetical protein VIL48_14350 [Acidimicrobiales bacterium]